MSDEHAPMRWRMTSRFEIRMRSWDGETILYHSGSGDTHLLDQYQARVLEWLRSDPLTEKELEARLATMLDLEDDETLPPYVRKLLLDLQKLNIVEPAT